LNFTARFPGDLLNLVFPTVLTEFGGGHPPSIVYRFAGNYSEQGLYLGLPLLAVVAAYAVSNRRSASTRFLVAALAIAIVAALGRTLNIGGRTFVRIPWRAVADLALFNNVLPVRLALYTSLLAAIILALWASAPKRQVARRIVAVVAALALVPKLTLPYWHSKLNLPPFFAQQLYKQYLVPGETVFVLERDGGPQPMLWQAHSDFYYRMADGYIQPSPPRAVQHYAAVKSYYLASGAPPARMADLLAYARDAGFTKVVVQNGLGRGWAQFMRRGGAPAPIDTGGVRVYTLPKR
jgi:hypothetical protein